MRQDNNQQPDDTQASDEKARAWVEKLRNKTWPSEDQDEFLAWCQKPGNYQALRSATQLHNDIRALKQHSSIGVLRQDILNGKAPARRQKPSATGDNKYLLFPSRRSVAIFTTALAACMALFAILPHFQNVYQSDIGEIKTIVLHDETKITLDTDSEVRVDYNENERFISLRRGQAFFEVSEDSRRKFVVKSGRDTVTAIGTAFSVRKLARSTAVYTTEGIVSIDSKRYNLSAERRKSLPKPKGASVTVRAGQHWHSLLRQPRPTNQREARLSWLNGTIVFRSKPIKEVIEEINRYSKKKVHLQYRPLQSEKIDAVYKIGHTESFTKAMSHMLGLNLKHDPAGNIILTKASPI